VICPLCLRSDVTCRTCGGPFEVAEGSAEGHGHSCTEHVGALAESHETIRKPAARQRLMPKSPREEWWRKR
jgi:hypothetical protein